MKGYWLGNKPRVAGCLVGVSRELSEGMGQTRGDKPVTNLLSVEAFFRDRLSARTRKPVEVVECGYEMLLVVIVAGRRGMPGDLDEVAYSGMARSPYALVVAGPSSSNSSSSSISSPNQPQEGPHPDQLSAYSSVMSSKARAQRGLFLTSGIM